MVCLFKFPEEIPQTYEETLTLIDQFTDHCKIAGSSFAHVVIDDYNLDDCFIKDCLRQESIEKWRQWRLEGIDTCTPLVEACNREELEGDIINIIRFLQYLTMIPTSAR